MDTPSTLPPPPDPPTAGASLTQGRRPYLWLGLMIGAFVAASVYGGIIAYYNLAIAQAHAYDLAIFQQAFSSTATGYHVPFYESTDCIVKGRCSFLIVHPSFVLYPFVPFYAAFPSPVTLFVERSLIVGLAALPLYWMTRHTTRSNAKALLAAALYLVWAPTLSGDLYSYHVESFIPLELFAMIALWQVGRYRLGLLVAAVSFVTLEVAPVFVFFIGLFFLAPKIEQLLRDARRRWKASQETRGRFAASARELLRSVRDALGARDSRYTVLLMVAAVVGYVAANLFLNEFGARLLGIPSPTVPPGLAGVFFNNSQKGTTFNLGVVVTSPFFGWSLEYWLVLYALVAFLPLLNLRSFVLVGVPWIAYSLLNTVHRFTTIGSQYTALAAVPIFLGVAYGLARVDFSRAPWTRAVRSTAARPSPVRRSVGVPRRRRTLPGWVAVLGILVAANVLLNPLVPLVPTVLGAPPGPFDPQYYEPWLTIQPGFSALEGMLTLIPNHESIAASNNLFPFVANDRYSYDLTTIPINFEGFPFNYSAGPDWVLTPADNVKGGGHPLNTELPNASIYQVRGYVTVSTQGPILLFQRGYDGPAQLFGPALAASTQAWGPENGLVLGPAGVLVAGASPSGGPVFATNSTSGKIGELAHAEAGFLPTGNYSLQVTINRTLVPYDARNTSRVLDLRLVGFSGDAWETNMTVADLPPGGWTTLTFLIGLVSPAVNAEVEVTWEDAHIPVELATLSFGPAG
jgi:uncharacterized membrane protein